MLSGSPRGCEPEGECSAQLTESGASTRSAPHIEFAHRNVTLPAMGGLPAETVTTGLRKSGVAQTLTLTSAGNTTALVTGVTYSGTGQLTSRSYGNGVTRNYTWSAETGALTGLSASFVTSESGSAQTVSVQNDTFTRDVMGRIVTSTSAVGRDAGSGDN